MVGFGGILLKEVVNIDFIVEVIEGGYSQEKMGFVLQELVIDPFLS